MPRFVILEHDRPHRHWDFMLETGAVLRTWRLAAPPEPSRLVPAEAMFDHRLHYLDYEGPIGGARGIVTRWDAGVFSWEEDAPERIVVVLSGRRCQGRAILGCVKSPEWSLTFLPE